MTRPENGASPIVVAVACHQNMVVGVRVAKDFVIGRGGRQDFSQSNDFVAHRFQGEGGIFGHIMVEEEGHAPVCI